jgi:hypothetical protein
MSHEFESVTARPSSSESIARLFVYRPPDYAATARNCNNDGRYSLFATRQFLRERLLPDDSPQPRGIPRKDVSPLETSDSFDGPIITSRGSAESRGQTDPLPSAVPARLPAQY